MTFIIFLKNNILCFHIYMFIYKKLCIYIFIYLYYIFLYIIIYIYSYSFNYLFMYLIIYLFIYLFIVLLLHRIFIYICIDIHISNSTGPSGLEACVCDQLPPKQIFFDFIISLRDPLAANHTRLSLFQSTFSTIGRSMGRVCSIC